MPDRKKQVSVHPPDLPLTKNNDMSKLLQTAKNLLHHDKTRPEATAVEKARPTLPSVPSGSSEMAIPALGHTTGYAHEMVVQVG